MAARAKKIEVLIYGMIQSQTKMKEGYCYGKTVFFNYWGYEIILQLLWIYPALYLFYFLLEILDKFSCHNN